MRHALLGLAALCAASGSVFATTPEFASSAPSYVRGNVIVGGGDSAYADPNAAVGPVEPIVGPGAFQSLYSPFNPHFESNSMVVFGVGGSLTLKFNTALPVTGGPEIGVFTSAGLVDTSFPNGTTGPVAMTFASQEYGAQRSAIVEVGSSLADMHSLGRVVFANPGNYYANVADETAAVAPPGAIPADFGKPFTQPLSAFDNQDFAGALNVTMDGSAGGTWIDVPTNLGISEVDFVRFSDPLWMLPDGSTATILHIRIRFDADETGGFVCGRRIRDSGTGQRPDSR